MMVFFQLFLSLIFISLNVYTLPSEIELGPLVCSKVEGLREVYRKGNPYYIWRGVENYDRKFRKAKDRFYPSNILDHIPDKAVVVDVGAGVANALMDLLKAKSSRIEKAVAISANKPSTIANNHGSLAEDSRFSYHKGFIEDFSSDELGEMGVLGESDLIFDIMGALQYSHDITSVLNQYGRMLKVGGLLYTSFVALNARHIGSKNRKGKVTAFLDRNGAEISALEFFQRIEGVEVVHSEEVVVQNVEHDISFILRKTGDIIVPKLKLVSIIENIPPHRTFQIVE